MPGKKKSGRFITYIHHLKYKMSFKFLGCLKNPEHKKRGICCCAPLALKKRSSLETLSLKQTNASLTVAQEKVLLVEGFVVNRLVSTEKQLFVSNSLFSNKHLINGHLEEWEHYKIIIFFCVWSRCSSPWRLTHAFVYRSCLGSRSIRFNPDQHSTPRPHK